MTQRGNRRQQTFFGDGDYRRYLEIAGEVFPALGVEVWGYCLMPNHVHLIAVPERPEALAAAVGAAHVRYTREVNRRERWTGYLWQGRFASFPMDEDYLLACTRYVGLNPVRAGLTRRAVDWPWSNVRAHTLGDVDALLTVHPLPSRLGDRMAGFFDIDVEEEARRKLRRATATGRPLGGSDWVKRLEASTGKSLADPPIGRPRRPTQAPGIEAMLTA